VGSLRAVFDSFLLLLLLWRAPSKRARTHTHAHADGGSFRARKAGTGELSVSLLESHCLLQLRMAHCWPLLPRYTTKHAVAPAPSLAGHLRMRGLAALIVVLRVCIYLIRAANVHQGTYRFHACSSL
jgi:hypothetical protein